MEISLGRAELFLKLVLERLNKLKEEGDTTSVELFLLEWAEEDLKGYTSLLQEDL